MSSLPFVLLAGDRVIASGPDSNFGPVCEDERVEFRPDGSTWDEANRLKERLREDARLRKAEHRSLRQKELGNRIIFAVTEAWRFAAHRAGVDVIAYLAGSRVGSRRDARRSAPTYVNGILVHPGNRPSEKKKVKVAKLQALGDHGEWCDVRTSDLLVALDEWREAGCPRRAWKKLATAGRAAPSP
jgi:hypothetical protein